MKVLVSAYAFSPEEPMPFSTGDDLLGWELAQQISQKYDVWILTQSHNRDAVMTEMAKGALEGAKVIFINPSRLKKILCKLGMEKTFCYYRWQIKAWRQAKYLHKKVKYDLVHHITLGEDWAPSFMGAFLSVPFVWGPLKGGHQVPESILKEFEFFIRFSERWKAASRCLGRRLWPRTRCIKKAKAILVSSQETRQKIPIKYHEKVHYFPKTGIHKKEIGPVPKKKQNQKEFVVLTLNRSHRFKETECAVRAFHLFSKENQNTVLEIIEGGKKKENLEDLIKQLDLKYRVKIKSCDSRKELLGLMKKCDVFLCSSFSDEEGGPVAAAMAQGKPVVGIDTAGSGFHIQKEWGIKIKPATREMVVNGLALALEKIYKNEPLRLKLGKAGRKRAKDTYVWDELGKRIKEIYEV
ncbi:MAG: glycosyltransferase family 4 protein [Acidobacteriota bacterium]